MKRIILFYIFICVVLGIKAQYKPLSVFKNDTTSFLLYNFMDRADDYKGKPFKKVIDDLKIPINYFYKATNFRSGGIQGMYLSIYSLGKSVTLADKGIDHVILVLLEEEIPENDLPDLGYAWNNKAYDYLKDLKIKSVQVVIERNSKYSQKYRKPETRSNIPPIKILPVEGGEATPLPVYEVENY